MTTMLLDLTVPRDPGERAGEAAWQQKLRCARRAGRGGAGGGRRARPAPARKRTRRCCAASSPMAVLALAGVRDECLASPASTSQPTTPTGCRSARSLRWWNKPEMERI